MPNPLLIWITAFAAAVCVMGLGGILAVLVMEQRNRREVNKRLDKVVQLAERKAMGVGR